MLESSGRHFMARAQKIIKEAGQLLNGRVDGKAKKIHFPTLRDQKRGYAMLLPLAESGNAKAQLELGKFLLRGSRSAVDHKAGAGWVERAAEQGLDEAQHVIATYYLELYESWQDRRVENLHLAYGWMKKAADQGYFWALMNNPLASCTLAYQKEAEAEFRQTLAAAEAGDLMAKRHLWVLYLGGCGVKPDKKKAASWLKKFEVQRRSLLPALRKRAAAGDDKARQQIEDLDFSSALPPFKPSKAKKTRVVRFVTTADQRKMKSVRSGF